MPPTCSETARFAPAQQHASENSVVQSMEAAAMTVDIKQPRSEEDLDRTSTHAQMQFPFFQRPADAPSEHAELSPTWVPPPTRPPPAPGTLPPPPMLSVETDLEDTINSTDSSWKAPSLSSLHNSSRVQPGSPIVGQMQGTDQEQRESTHITPGTKPRLIETDFEDTLHSTGLDDTLHSTASAACSAASGSPTGRRKISLGGMASASNTVAGVRQLHGHAKPRRAAVPARVPRVFDRPEAAPAPPPLF